MKKLFGALLLGLSVFAGAAQAQTPTFMNALTASGATASTDQFAVCQVVAGCGSGNSLTRSTIAQLLTFMQANLTFPAGANPTATAGPTANNGVATTFMRSDASPLVQKGTNAQFGLVEGDASTITCVAGVCTVIAAPLSGITGLGTGVATALGVNVGAAGAFAKNNGDALSGTYTGAPTFSGNLTFSGRPIYSGTLTGTQVSCLGLDVSNNLTVAGSPCGSGGGGGAITLVSTQTASASASLQWTGLTGTDYILRCRNIIPATTAVNGYIQFGTGVTPTWAITAYQWAGPGVTTSGSAVNGSSASDSGFDVTNSTLGNSAEGLASFRADIYNLSATATHSANWQSFSETGGGGHENANGSGTYTGATTAVTGVRLIMSSGNITSGSCSLYQVQS